MRQAEYARYYTAQLEAWQTADATMIENEKQRLHHEADIIKAKLDAMDKIKPIY